MKSKILAWLCAMLLVIVPCAFGLESTGFNANWNITYFGTTDQPITVSWDHNDPKPTRYEVELLHVERNQNVAIGKTAENSLTFKLPRSGHFIAKIRAADVLHPGYTCDKITNIPEGLTYEDTEAGCMFFSDWSLSTDPTVARVMSKAGELLNRPWWIYGYVAPPGQPTIGGR